jgi:acyl-homoserine lactone acylase PvdQ
MAPDGQNYRAINAARLLESKKNLTVDRVIDEIGYSHYLAAFEDLLPPLFAAWDSLPDKDSIKESVRGAIDSLRNWDRNAAAASVATTLAIEWAYRMDTKAGPAIHPYALTDAIGKTYRMLINTTGKEKLQLLLQTMQDLELRFGTWNTPWGEVNRYQRLPGGRFNDSLPSMPVGLGPATWGSLPSFAARRFPNTSKRYGLSGNSFIACVEFGKKIKAKTVITGGQSFDPASSHYLDQAEMYIEGKFKDVLFYPEDLEGHVERKYHPGE